MAVEDNFILKNLSFSNLYNLYFVEKNSKEVEDFTKQLAKQGVTVINIGKELAEKLKMLNNTKFITVEALQLLRELFKKKEDDTQNNPIFAIYNLGILLEPTLDLAVTKILADISRDKVIIIIWNHLVKDGSILYWDEESFNEYNFNFSEYYIKKLDI